MPPLCSQSTANASSQQFKDGIFRVIKSSSTPIIVVAPKYLNELKRLPDDVLSFDYAIEETMHTKYTRLESHDLVLPTTVKTSLTPALNRLNPTLAEEVAHTIRSEMPAECDKDWHPVNINNKLVRMVAIISGRIFVGPELCHSEEYIDMAINYTLDLMHVRTRVENLKPWLRPFLANFLPETKKLDERIAKADAILQPIVEQRRKLITEGGDRPDDMLQWMVDDQLKSKHGSSQTGKLARLQLGITFAAIHTTTLTATNVFYNLAAYPEYIPELRDEITEVLREHGGVFSSPAMQAMKKLDSFMKESMRKDPTGVSSFQRKVLKDFVLPGTQQVIPKGSIIEVAQDAISRDESVFPEPEKFKPWRFYELRQQARERGEVEKAAQNQFVSVSQDVLTFGYGRHACPGRFFAANELKMIAANMILQYDIKNVEGQVGRIPNFEHGGTVCVSPMRPTVVHWTNLYRYSSFLTRPRSCCLREEARNKAVGIW